MGKVMKKNIQGMSWLGKTSLVLLLTLMTSVFMYDGLCNPRTAAAAITTTVTPASAVGTTAPASANVTIPLSVAGNKRMLVVGITLEGATAATATVNCTYGGTGLTAIPGTETGSTSALQHTYLFYMLDNTTLMNNTARALTFTVSGFTMTGNSMHYAVYDGVAQGVPAGYSSTSGTTDATTISLSSPLDIASGDIGFVVAMTSRSGSTTARTFTTPTNWTSVAIAAANATSPATNRYCYTSTTVASTSVSLTASGTSRLSESGFVIKMSDTTAPTANNNVSVSPNVNGTYTSSSPTITATFTEPDFGSSVTSCEYTTNGSTWVAGSVSGSGPTYTCTANPTGLSGSLTINMRATSVGGGPTASTAITRTVDSTPPADGVLTVYPGNPNNGLFWTAATDTLSGVNHYDVYFQTGAVSPACGAGTLLYTGTNRNAIHSGLPGNTQYSYRVCATDNTGLVSSGATGTVTTTARPSVINTCNGCHGYAPVDNASRVGGATGQFPGSHDQHAGTAAGQSGYACTKCHSDNSTLNHANSTIEMALSPGSYSRGTGFAVTNSFTPGNCSNTYCHSNGTGGTNQSDGRSIASNTSPNWGGTTGCNSCHGAGSSDGRPLYQSGSPKMNNHTSSNIHHTSGCQTCHYSVTNNGTSISDGSKHNNGYYNIDSSSGLMSYTFGVNGGTCANACHRGVAGGNDAVWGQTLKCVDCHSYTITRNYGRPGVLLGAVTDEFGQTYGHKKSGRSAVSDDDCIVCHLEGNGTTHRPSSTYHANGNIDLRDPWGAGETPITNMSDGAFTFARFSTSYEAGSRSSSFNNTDIAQVISLRFCIRCHSKQGATNPTARSNNGGTGSATMPFGGVNLGANYTVLNGASVAGGVVNVFSQFSSTNSSVHPVKGPRIKDFPTQARLNAPYNSFTRVGTAGTTAAGIMLNCFDCHNSNTAPLLTRRTISAHGTSRTAMVRGAIYSTNNTLCAACHSGYTVTGNHGTGSAMATSTGRTDEGFNNNCMNCHGSKTTAPTTAQTRPIAAQDFHGSNALLSGGLWPTINARPVAFIRGWSGTAYHRGRALAGTSGYAAGSATCGAGTCPTGGNVGDGSNRTYTPGGTY